MAESKSTTPYDVINEYIMAQLDKGTIPWRKPWKSFGPPCNLLSGKPYRGVNHFILRCAPYASPYYLTFKQAKELGGSVRKGEKSAPCIFWTEWNKTDESGDETKIPVLRYYSVFNTEQCEGIEHKRLAEMAQAEAETKSFSPIAQAELVIASMPKRPAITFEGTSAFYRPSADLVNVPKAGLFESPESYYEVLFHELSHSTGHESRIGRKAVQHTAFFGSYDYGQEELVAEMSAAYLCGHCGIERPVLDNQAAYINSWLHAIKADRKLIISAAAQAQKAADYILSERPEA